MKDNHKLWVLIIAIILTIVMIISAIMGGNNMRIRRGQRLRRRRDELALAVD
jgi:hypothetical protein